MAKQFNPLRECMTPEFRLSFPKLLIPEPFNAGDEPKYSCNALFSKATYPTKDSILEPTSTPLTQAVNAAASDKYGDQIPAVLKHPIKDGDTAVNAEGVLLKEGNPHYANHWIVSMNTRDVIRAVGPDGTTSLTEGMHKAGFWARAQVSAGAWKSGSNIGIGIYIKNIMITRPDTVFTEGGSQAPEKAFAQFGVQSGQTSAPAGGFGDGAQNQAPSSGAFANQTDAPAQEPAQQVQAVQTNAAFK